MISPLKSAAVARAPPRIDRRSTSIPWARKYPRSAATHRATLVAFRAP